MALPIVQHPDQSVMLVQQKWKSKLDPVFSNQNIDGRAINNVNLKAGSTTIPHGLDGTQRGWTITDQTAAAQIFRSAPFNDQNLILTSSAAVTVNLWVF